MKQIRESKFSKIVAYYLMIMMFIQVTQPVQMYALTSGPTQPEFNSFTPIGTSDMVDLTSGDFNYNIPVMDVGGYPLNLSYNSGITTDQEASWVGLGWNMNVGQIERQVRGLPDDFNGTGENGDVMRYQNDLKENRTVGMSLGVNAAILGFDALNLGVGLGIESNNYEGISFKPSFGIGFQFNDNVSVGMNFTSSVGEGATVTPSVSLSSQGDKQKDGSVTSLKGSASLGLSSRKGVENLNLSASVSRLENAYKNIRGQYVSDSPSKNQSVGGSISFNDQSFTPSKRVGFQNTNFSFNGALGGEVFGVEGQVQVTGYGSYQKIKDEYKDKWERAFGYENTQFKNDQAGVLDFNRENERTVNENTTALPLTNYTYDLYSIDGQGVSGMFRPYRSQVGNLYNDEVSDSGDSDNFGLEVGVGNLVHGSGDFKAAPSESRTGPWRTNNYVFPYFKESNTDNNRLKYEQFTYKMVGGMIVDPEQAIYNDRIYQAKALRMHIDGRAKNGSAMPAFIDNDRVPYPIISKIKREQRYLRSQLVHKVTYKEANGDPLIIRNPNASNKPHHTAGIKVTQSDGSTYVYGATAYNVEKVEATFDVSVQNNSGSNTTGLISYNGDINGNISGNSTNTSDGFLNKITTPKYAHSFMLSSVLSSDYEDLDHNGPTINDLGGYTKFEYEKEPGANYKWRIPFQGNKASYNDGLISKKDDQKGTYIYGEKELVYLKKIVTKTHVAFFDIEARKDAIGVAGQAGGPGTGRMKKIKSIRLYSLPEVTNASGQIVDPLTNGSTVKPIKTAHFVYSYNLCKGVPNNEKNAAVQLTALTQNEISNAGGKLTLEKVYFTYRGSNMGKYTPYKFNYGSENVAENNPDYGAKDFDIWGNYKKNAGGSGYIDSPLSNTEFPYVKQSKDTTDVERPDKNIQAWNLKSINLPSGGEIKIEIESDDYQYVQDKKAMQMFKVIGAGDTPNPSEIEMNDKTLYNGNHHRKFLYVKLSQSDLLDSLPDMSALQRKQWFIDNYLRQNYSKPIQFKFLLNMFEYDKYYDYVSGYFKIDQNPAVPMDVKSDNAYGTVAVIPLTFLSQDGGINSGAPVNPIAKAGWGFGRTYLNRLVYGGLGGDGTDRDFESIVDNLEESIHAIKEIFTGPNKALQNKDCAKIFKAKSWIRLENPDGRKLGGGLRVKSIKLSDKWTSMLTQNGGTDLTDMEYGQTYNYDDVNGKSSGVATFEPNSCSENPLVVPMDNNSLSYADNIAAPREINYFEKPFGENFFPAAKVTYSRVSVKNIEYKDIQHRIVKKHATGKIVTEHFTTSDFPTKVSYTNVEVINDLVPNNIIGSLVQLGNISIKNHLTMSQGYSIETNDMNGKVESQTVFDEQDSEISSVKYKYNVDDAGNLDNNLTTIDNKGKVEKRLIGLDYDMINDFNESFSSTETMGFDANFGSFLVAIFPVFVPLITPKKSYNENQLRTAVTTKHIHKTGTLIETIASDLGSTVSTKNLAWDASSGQVLLTETVNEYSDHYFSFTYPAYWMYEGMGLASQNIGVEGKLRAMSSATPPSATNSNATTNPYFDIEGNTGLDLTTIFHLGDELHTTDAITQSSESSSPNILSTPVDKLWVVGFREDKKGILLMDRFGNYINKCLDLNIFPFKIVRSGYRNLSSASMASVTSMINPIDEDGNGIYNNIHQNSFVFSSGSASNPRVINSSGIVYKEYWTPQNEGSLPFYPEYNPNLVTVRTYTNPFGVTTTTTTDSNPVNTEGLPNYPYNIRVNPYLWNIKGEWRAEKSYAYLAGRNKSDGKINNPRNEGFYDKFAPFYQLTNGLWTMHTENWTYATSISKYSPYGSELENKDALNRYSSAQYGYQYKLPMAVASNSKYEQMGYEGFEEIKLGSYGKHFEFGETANQFSTQQSHTGKSSLKVSNGQTSTLSRDLLPRIGFSSKARCPITTTNPPPVTGDCPGLGIVSPGVWGLVVNSQVISSVEFCQNIAPGAAYAVKVGDHGIRIYGPAEGSGTLNLKVTLADGSLSFVVIYFNPTYNGIQGGWRHLCYSSHLYINCEQ